MSTTYPGLGFDPAPGDADALDALARRCRRTAGGLRRDVDALRAAPGAVTWRGSAAAAFASYVTVLPRDLERAASSYDVVASSVRTYAEHLRLGRRLAAHADDDASAAELSLTSLLRQAAQARAAGDDVLVAMLERRAAVAGEEAETARRRGRQIEEDVRRAAVLAARRIEQASDAPYSAPGLLDRIVGSARSWVADHADVLADLSAVLKGVSAVAGVLSLIPVLAPICAPVAVAAGLAALAVDAALVSAGRASVRSVAVDAGLSVVPGVGRVVGAGLRQVRTVRGSVVVYRVEGAPNTRVMIARDGDVRLRGSTMLFLNFGQRARAEELLARRVEQGMDGACIKRFRVQKEVLDDLRQRAVREDAATRFPDRPHKVDLSMAPDQYGLRAAQIQELRPRIVPRSGKVM